MDKDELRLLAACSLIPSYSKLAYIAGLPKEEEGEMVARLWERAGQVADLLWAKHYASKPDKKAVADWRVGLKVKLRGTTIEDEHVRGEVVAVLPSGAAGIMSSSGVLVIRAESGRVLLQASEFWSLA